MSALNIFMFFLISFFWFIREIKTILFWLYLWQLKEYRLDRFLDHFRTAKGKRLLFNKLIFFKLFLFVSLLFIDFGGGSSLYHLLPPSLLLFIFLLVLFTLYFFESIKAFSDFFQKRLIKPVPTKKAIFLFSINVGVGGLFFLILFFILNINFFSGILAFDIFTPLIVSGIVLIFQPLTVFWKNQILKKAIKKRKQFKDLLVIGITGSYGKTSTKEFLATILSEKFKVLKTKEHQNNEIGVALCILNDLKKEHQIFVCEMGAYKKGEIKLLADIARPKIGILTGINEQHLATFGSMENLISAEGGKELIESLPQDGLMIFNGVNPYCQKIYQETKLNKKIISINFWVNEEKSIPADFWVEEIKVNKESLSFQVVSRDKEKVGFLVNLLGAQNIENILLATCCAKELGMNLDKVAKSCLKLKPLPRQMELKKGKNGLKIIDSTYSTNPDGVIAHLEYLKIWQGRKVIIMPCLIELGKASKEIHKRIGKKIAEVCDLAIITTKDRFREIKEKAGEKAIFLENSSEIFEKIKSFCQEGDIILLEGRLSSQLINLLVGQ